MNERRLLAAAQLGIFTSAEFADTLHISRSCASQHLLELRRSGFLGRVDRTHWLVTPKTIGVIRSLVASASEASFRAEQREARLRDILTTASVAVADSKMTPRRGAERKT